MFRINLNINLNKDFLCGCLLFILCVVFSVGCGRQEPASKPSTQGTAFDKTKTGQQILMEKRKQIEEGKEGKEEERMEEVAEEPSQEEERPVEEGYTLLSLDDREKIKEELDRISHEVNKALESDLSWTEKEARRNELRADLWEFCAEGPYEIEARKAERWIEEYIEKPFREAEAESVE